MDKNRIHDMIDRDVLKSFTKGNDISFIKNDLSNRFSNFKKSLELDKSININELMSLDFDEIESKRIRFGITYIKHCQKRIKDLNWILDKKSEFEHLTNSKIFKLILFKEKMSIENAVYEV